MDGILYGVGVGPGDPELMTLKAQRIISACPVVAVPDSGAGTNIALSIARSVIQQLDQKEIVFLPIPMKGGPENWRQSHEAAADRLSKLLRNGKNVAMLCLGDPSIFASFGYLSERMQQRGFTVQTVAGVPSFCAVAAVLNQSLTTPAEPLHILPASYPGWEKALTLSGTKVMMKAGRYLDEVIEMLKTGGYQAVLVQNCGMEGERIYRSLEEYDGKHSYFTTIMIRNSSGG